MKSWVIILLIAVGVAIWLWQRRRGVVPPLVEPQGIRLRLTQIKGDPLDTPFNLTLYDRLVIGRDLGNIEYRLSFLEGAPWRLKDQGFPEPRSGPGRRGCPMP
jgi:hypothetical protein